MTVGFIGLGNMGQGMVDNLLEKGADLTVFTRTRSKIEAMIDRGAKGATSIADLTQKVEVVLACLPDVQTSRDLLLGENGVIPNARPGQVVVDHSTVDIATSRACAEAAEARGVHFLDAPISGGPGGAAGGTLAIMVGGNEHAFETAHEYFGKMGANVKLMGPNGAGTAMKLINQLLVGINTVAAAEAFALANSAGVDIQTAADLLAVAWGGSAMVDRSAPITAAREFPDSAAPVRNLHKDMGIIKALAEDEGLSLEMALKSEEMFRHLMDQGKIDHDIAGVLEVVEERSR
ncbi:MAG: NAD(P)-dependent oxidoreductase [Dehalococcoidia bacterium]|jgi:3-hydroxyisobutyrate dehydrogenase-like beta-hydroxyacid dehydrogenase|nr:NAD(P)-dependent oxidoreductase [Dehalococcoidia bacterium]